MHQCPTMRPDEKMVTSGNQSNETASASVGPVPTSTTSGSSRIRVCFLGSPGVGKTAVVVRYLTNRFIQEYCSGRDLLYKKTVRIDGIPSPLEIADTSNPPGEISFPSVHVLWADACVVVYSIQNKASFRAAAGMLDTIQRLKVPFYTPVLLLANKKDLEHLRQVPAEDGQGLAVALQCHFAEVSAAEEVDGSALCLTALFREVRTLRSQRTVIRQTPSRRPALQHVSKLFSSLIGRGGSNQQDEEDSPSSAKSRTIKKRPSFSL